jgi:ligand-binding sensor domain-containing protein
MMRRLVWLVTGLIVLIALSATGQGLPMLHFTKNDGLPSNTIYSLYKDSKGFLWVATDKGVARYNGVKFETFTTFDGLSDNEVFFFQEDLSGRLWLATYNGELCYYKDDTFHLAANTPYLKLPGKTAHISYIGVEKDGSVTIQFLNKSMFVNVSKEKLKVFTLEKEMEQRGIKGAYFLVKKVDDNNYDLVGNYFAVTIDSNCKIISDKTGKPNLDFSVRQNQNVVFTFNDHIISFNRDTTRYSLKRFKGQLYQFYYDGDQLLLLQTTDCTGLMTACSCSKEKYRPWCRTIKNIIGSVPSTMAFTFLTKITRLQSCIRTYTKAK